MSIPLGSAIETSDLANEVTDSAIETAEKKRMN
jgi:hypothetical protein